MTIRYMHGEGQPVIAARLAERLRGQRRDRSEMVTRLVREGLLAVDAETRQLDLTEAAARRPSGRSAAMRCRSGC